MIGGVLDFSHLHQTGKVPVVDRLAYGRVVAELNDARMIERLGGGRTLGGKLLPHAALGPKDQQAGEIEPKSRAGTRTVPIASVLREHLIAHRLRSGRAIGLAFGRDADRPFTTTCVYDRAAKAWSTLNAERAENELDALEPIGLHECRHTFASLMIAAGVNAKALSTYMGHASITITLDRYGHLMPGNEKDAAGLLDTYLRDNCATVATVV